jgi:hypothetical protein
MSRLKRIVRGRQALDRHDRFLASAQLRAYRPSQFDRWCRDGGFDIRERRFFDFRPPLLIDRLAPAASLAMGRRLEAIGGSRAGTLMGAGYLVRVSRGEA